MQFMLVHNKEDLRHQQYKTKHFLTIANIFSKKKKKKKNILTKKKKKQKKQTAGISSSCKVKHAL